MRAPVRWFVTVSVLLMLPGCRGTVNRDGGSGARAAPVVEQVGGSAAKKEGGSGGARVALVVGNSAYTRTSPLANPVNDAADMAAALEGLDFDVILEMDADEDAMDDALADFEERSAGAAVALVFYAGHGMEMNGANYLVPVDAELATASAVGRETIALDMVLDATSGARTRIVILDACRNNPFARSMRGARRANVRSGGLAAVSTGEGLLVAYAAAAGDVAADGEGSRNSPFTTALLEHLRSPGVELRVMLGNVGGAVSRSTGADQQPFVYTSLSGEHYLAGRDEPVVVVDDSSRRQQETVFWQSIMNSTNAADFEAFLEEFPNGTFARLATNRLAPLRAPATDSPALDPGSLDPEPARSRHAGEVFRDCPTCPELVVVPAGRFRMGCVSGRDCQDDERPVHEVEVGSFALGVYEVTFDEYERFARATGRDRPHDRGWGRGGRPVINVSWQEATAYAAWRSAETGEKYRLPSEAEWEYAARAGTTTRYSWGDDRGRNRANCDGCGSRWDDDETAPAGSFAVNAWGLHDMHGNVWEWVEDCWHDNYARAPRDGSAWTTGGNCSRRVLRGGGWYSYPRYLRSASRSRDVAGLRSSSVGFRVARTLD